MNDRFLLDEDLPRWWLGAIRLRLPQLTIRRIGVVGTPPFGSSDKVILEWCEGSDFLFLTNNRTSMPGHLADHLASGRHIPGIFHVPDDMSVMELGDHLDLIAGASFPGEFRDQIRYLPV